MIYTQMLFALSFDKFFFGTIPDITSIIGSTLILGSAIGVAVQQSKATKTDEPRDDEHQEEAIGLMGALDDEESLRPGAMPIQEVQVRALR